MKILHLIPSISPVHGGPSFALPLMANSLVQAGVTVDIATTDDDGPGRRMEVELGKRMERDGYGLVYFRKQTEFYKASWPFRQWIRAHVTDYDAVHIHALFSYTSNCAARAAYHKGVPYIIRLLGVLNQWGLENRRPLLKSWSMRFIEKPILRRAAAIHFTSQQEQTEASAAFPLENGVVIPLGIDVSRFDQLPDAKIFLDRFPAAAGRPRVLFLSRIDPKKGLELLLPAFARVRERNAQALLVIAGSGADGYVAQLKDLARRLNIAESVLWTGRLDGEVKMGAFAAATLFVLPSHSENFGIALVEALAAGLPCVTTTGVAVSEDVAERDAGIVLPLSAVHSPTFDSAALSTAITRLLEDESLRARLGGNAKRLAADRFSSKALGVALQKLYGKITRARNGKS